MLRVDVLVTASTAAASALAQTTTSLPIVFVGTFDPVAAGLVDSLDHPGRHLTGIAGFQADIATKWVAQLKELAVATANMAKTDLRHRHRINGVLAVYIARKIFDRRRGTPLPIEDEEIG